MFFSKVASFAFVLLAVHFVNAAPLPQAVASPTDDITAAELNQMGAFANCSSAMQFPDECRTAEQAAPFVNQAFSDFGLVTHGEKSALLSLMLFESGGFAFDINHSLNTQGTRNLMTFLFIFQSGANVANATAEPPDTQILSDPSALPARCGFTCKAARRHRGWWPGSSSRRCPTGKKYITICVFTTVTPERQALYEKTLNVFLAEIASGN